MIAKHAFAFLRKVCECIFHRIEFGRESIVSICQQVVYIMHDDNSTEGTSQSILLTMCMIYVCQRVTDAFRDVMLCPNKTPLPFLSYAPARVTNSLFRARLKMKYRFCHAAE
jgi:hypothetical protein